MRLSAARPFGWGIGSEHASDVVFGGRTLKVVGEEEMEGRKEDGGRREKAMDGTNKDCTSGQKTRCPTAIPGVFQSPLIAGWWQLPGGEGTSPRTEHEGEAEPAGDVWVISTRDVVGEDVQDYLLVEASGR